MRDTILPTRPTSLRTGENLATLRARLMREQQQKLPADLTAAHLVYGIEIEFPPDQAPVHWRNPDHEAAPRVTTSATRATCTWSATLQPPLAPLELISANGRVLAAIQLEGPGTAIVTTTATTHAWPWLAITRATPAAASTWETLHDVPPPPSWRIDAPPGRIDLVPAPAFAGAQRRTVAVVDVSTGWALLSELQLDTDYPSASFRLAP